jgi:hypothetical protein
MGQDFPTATPAKFDQFHVRQNGTFTERDLRHEVVQCNRCNGSQFRSAVLNLSSHFGIWRAFVMLPEAMKYFGGHMAKIIEFYKPPSFHKVSKWLPPAPRGKVLAFPLAVRKSA